MAVTVLSICNSALIKLGAERLTSLEDDSKEALLCNEQYEKIRDELIYSHPWNFATRSEVLTSNGNSHPWNGMEEFDIPSDCLRFLDFDSDDVQFVVEEGFLYADDSELNSRYIFLQDDVTLYSTKFVELLATRLALELSYSLVQSAGLKETLRAEYQEILRDARSFDSQEGNPGRLSSSRWETIRR